VDEDFLLIAREIGRHPVSNDAGGCQAFLVNTSPEARSSAPFRSSGKGFDVQTKAVFL
jgi:hypothetical protein